MNEVGFPPMCVRWVPRNSENADCTIIAFQLACGLTYEEVLSKAIPIRPQVVSGGMHGTEMVKLAEALGYAARWVRRGKYDLETATGILAVRSQKRRNGSPVLHHCVYLWAGRIIEPATETLWEDPSDYLKCEKWLAGSLLVLTKKEG